jgi:hypothetical protein
VFAHATKAASAFEFFSCCAYGVRSATPNGDRIFETVWPLLQKTSWTAATLPAPNAVSSPKTTIFLPDDFGGKIFAASRTSCSVCRPARNVLRLSPVIAAAAAAPGL